MKGNRFATRRGRRGKKKQAPSYKAKLLARWKRRERFSFTHTEVLGMLEAQGRELRRVMSCGHVVAELVDEETLEGHRRYCRACELTKQEGQPGGVR